MSDQSRPGLPWSAAAQAAANFRDKILADMPFPVKAIQVDGGSEFMAQFEAACQAEGVALYLLPPRSPQMNSAVERCNGAWRYEFSETYVLPSRVNELNPILGSCQHLYNHHRPHGSTASRVCYNLCLVCDGRHSRIQITMLKMLLRRKELRCVWSWRQGVEAQFWDCRRAGSDRRGAGGEFEIKDAS